MAKKPEFGVQLPASHPRSTLLEALQLRRSTPAELISEPGPDAETLRDILTIAARVPDHRKMTPFRFIVFSGEGRARMGDVLADALTSAEPGADDNRLAVERGRFLRAPVVVGVVSVVDSAHRTPEWEQILCAGGVCFNLLLAASAHGFAAQWITEWCAYDSNIRTALGLRENERVAGFIYIGSANEEPRERGRPEIEQIVSYY